MSYIATFTDIKGNLGVKLIITETSQSIPNNTTTISYSARVYKTQTHNPWNHYTQTPFKLIINGEVIYNQNANYDLRDWTSASRLSRTEQVITSGTRTITHSADGSKSISVSWSGDFTSTGAGYGYGSVLASDTMKLTDIPRISKPSLSKVNFNFGESVVLTTNRMSNNFTHSASYIAGGVETLLATDIGVSENIAIPISRASSIPNSSSESMKIRVKTFNGTTEIGSQDISVTVNVPATVIPKVDGVTLSETVSKANIFSSNNSNYIRGISKVKTTAINPRGEYGSTIVKYEFRLKEDTSYNGTTTSSNFTFGEIRLPTSGTALYSFQCRVQDSRGRYSTWADSTQVRFHYYTPPTISTPGLSRNDTVLSVERSYSVQSIMENGIERNAGSLSFQTRPKGSSSWIANGGAKYTGMNLSKSSSPLSGIFLDNVAYEVQGILSDKLNTIYSGIAISGADFVTLEVLLGTGIGVGKSPIAGNGDLQVGSGGINSEGHYKSFNFSTLERSNSGTSGFIAKGIPLTGDSYIERVLLLIPVSTTETVNNNHVHGEITLSKSGGNVWHTISVSAQSVYNATYANYTSFAQPHQMITCNYNGRKWLAIRLAYEANPWNNMWFYGRAYSDMPGGEDMLKSISIYNHSSGTKLNSEIYDSMVNYTTNRQFFKDGQEVFHRGNDGSGSGLDADLLDGLHASSFAKVGDIPTVPAAYTPTSGGSGDNRWIRFPSGHQICWGSTTTTGSSKAVTFPRAFTATPMITVTGHHATHSPSTTLSAASASAATFYIVDGRNGGLWGGSYTSGMTATLRYIAVGIG